MAVRLRARRDASGKRLRCGRCGCILAQLVPVPDWDGEEEHSGLVAQLPAGYVPSPGLEPREFHPTRMRNGKPAFRRHLPLPDEEGPCIDALEAVVLCWKCQRPNLVSRHDGHFSTYVTRPRRRGLPPIPTTKDGRRSIYHREEEC